MYYIHVNMYIISKYMKQLTNKVQGNYSMTKKQLKANRKRVKAWRKAHPIKNRRINRLHQTTWRDDNPGLNTHRVRLCQLKDYIPKGADLKAIERFYVNRPKNKEVDHIKAINGPRTGKHVISNLQYLTPKQNRRKSNKQ